MARETRNLAVLFADICDSTRLYQELGDEAARSAVGACLTLMAKVARKHAGRVVKTIGDEAFMTFPDADRALLAASEMQSAMAGQIAGSRPLRLHCGLQAGPVLVEEDDVFGDTVNAAAYLTAVATEDQILTTESVEAQLSPVLKAAVRPVFKTMLKGASGGESTIYQVLWRTDNTELTDVNFHAQRFIPADTGSLLLAYRDKVVRIDQQRHETVVGRGDECALVVPDKYASRQHMTIRLMRTHFYLIDHSINGTYVTLESGDEVHVLRGELLLDRAGKICLGRSRHDGVNDAIVYRRDRRSMYRL